MRNLQKIENFNITQGNIVFNNIKLFVLNLFILLPINLCLLFLWNYLQAYLPYNIAGVLWDNTTSINFISISLKIPSLLLYLIGAHLLQLLLQHLYLAPIQRLYLHPEFRPLFSPNYLSYGFIIIFLLPLLFLLYGYNFQIGASQLVPHYTINQLYIFQNLFIIALWYTSSKILQLSNSIMFRFFQHKRFCTEQISQLYHNKAGIATLAFLIMISTYIFHLQPFLRFYTQNNFAPYDLNNHMIEIIIGIVTIVIYGLILYRLFLNHEKYHMHLFEEFLYEMTTSEADYSHRISTHADKISICMNKFLSKLHNTIISTQSSSMVFENHLNKIIEISNNLENLPKFNESSPAYNSLNELSSYVSKIHSNFDASREKLNADFVGLKNLPEDIYFAMQLSYEIKYQTSLCLSNAEIIKNKIEIAMKKSKFITEAMHRISDNIKSAGTEAEFIDEILLLLQDIAEQTNILSINAALEAAHAGNSGKGFAIVSHEVRSLATASSDAVDDISQKLISIQNFIKIAVDQVANIEQITTENHMLITESYNIINRVIKNFQNIEIIAVNTCNATGSQGKVCEKTFAQINNFLDFLNTYQTMLKQQNDEVKLLREKTTVIPLFEKEIERHNEHLHTYIKELQDAKKELSEKISELTSIDYTKEEE